MCKRERERERERPNDIILFAIYTMDKEGLHSVSEPLRHFSWRKMDRIGITSVTWNHLASPKHLGEVVILNLSMHIMAHKFSILQNLRSHS